MKVERTRCDRCGQFITGIPHNTGMSGAPLCNECFTTDDSSKEDLLELAESIDELKDEEQHLTEQEQYALAYMKDVLYEQLPERQNSMVHDLMDDGYSFTGAVHGAYRRTRGERA